MDKQVELVMAALEPWIYLAGDRRDAATATVRALAGDAGCFTGVTDGDGNLVGAVACLPNQYLIDLGSNDGLCKVDDDPADKQYSTRCFNEGRVLVYTAKSLPNSRISFGFVSRNVG